MTEEVKFRSDMGVELIQTWGGDEMVARSARVSTGSDQLELGKINGLIKYLVSEDHDSTLRHSGMTFRFEAPLFVLSQAVRHKFLDVNVQSGRYTQFKPEFYLPENRPVENKGSSARPRFDEDEPEHLSTLSVGEARAFAIDGYSRYRRLIEEGVSNEVARNVLPQTTYTAWYASGSLNAWMDFLTLRNGEKGYPQWEIVNLAKQVEMHMAWEFPITYGEWKAKQ